MPTLELFSLNQKYGARFEYCPRSKRYPASINHHNIDLHAVTGPGGGAAVTNVTPGASKTFTFKAINPGLYVYHCAHPNVATYDAHGMYGLILVEPKAELPVVDKEFYVVQGEFYSASAIGNKGLQVFDAQKMLDGHPEYAVFNGKTKSLAENMKANVGNKVRIFFGYCFVSVSDSENKCKLGKIKILTPKKSLKLFFGVSGRSRD